MSELRVERKENMAGGKGHGLTNTGDTDLVFMALIILD